MRRSNRYLVGAYVIGAPVRDVISRTSARPAASAAAGTLSTPRGGGVASAAAGTLSTPRGGGVASAAAGPLSTPKGGGVASAAAGPLSTPKGGGVASAAAGPLSTPKGGGVSSALLAAKNNAAARAGAAADNLLAAAGRLAKRRPTTARNLVAFGNRLKLKASRATKITGNEMIGDYSNLANLAANTDALQAAANELTASGSVANALVVAADGLNAVLADIDRAVAAGLNDLADEGNAIAWRYDDVISASGARSDM